MEKALLANIKSLIETMQLSVEQAMNALRVPAGDRARLSAQLWGITVSCPRGT